MKARWSKRDRIIQQLRNDGYDEAADLLDATAAPVVVGEDMVSRALDAQPFTDQDCANRAWQYLSSLDDQKARKFMRAALIAALGGG